jgi:hypothetical protein
LNLGTAGYQGVAVMAATRQRCSIAVRYCEAYGT